MPFRRFIQTTRQFHQRTAYIAGGLAIGVAAWGFAELADQAQALFHRLADPYPLAVWIITPLGFVLCAFLAKHVFPNTAGSGIPQCIAAMEMQDEGLRNRLLSLRVAFGKIVLTLLGLLCGASIGREGPTVQVGASLMLVIGRVVKAEHRGLILAGSAAGIAAAFNAPLAGIVFTIEELSRAFESKTSGLILTATILAGLAATQLGGNYAYFGYASGELGSVADWAALLVTGLLCGLLGGCFAKAMIAFSANKALQEKLGRTKRPLLFALGCGIVVAGCGWLSGGTTYGTGYREAYGIIHEHHLASWVSVPLKMIATWVSSLSGIPGGLFAPSLSVGAETGSLVAQVMPVSSATQFALLGMAAYLTGVLQSPITSTVIMAEMTDNHAMVVPLLACALIADMVSKAIHPRSLYHSLMTAYLPPHAVQG
ncbi:chloride channel protein [Aestuariivirga sp.]|uniref:chloride channel protein n=1 Tax=Aestuariivirga sp. TaxID=2650926 RepID=UPI0039E22771